MQISIGQKATRSITLTADHVKIFAGLSGDHNPLHFDESFVAKTKFKKLVVQGGLTTGLLHALVAMDMPGPGTVFLSQNWKFTAPVFIGDTITAEAEVITVPAFTGAPEQLWRIDQLTDGTYRIMPKVIPNSKEKLALVSSGDSTPALATFDMKSDNSKWNFKAQ